MFSAMFHFTGYVLVDLTLRKANTLLKSSTGKETEIGDTDHFLKACFGISVRAGIRASYGM